MLGRFIRLNDHSELWTIQKLVQESQKDRARSACYVPVIGYPRFKFKKKSLCSPYFLACETLWKQFGSNISGSICLVSWLQIWSRRVRISNKFGCGNLKFGPTHGKLAATGFLSDHHKSMAKLDSEKQKSHLVTNGKKEKQHPSKRTEKKVCKNRPFTAVKVLPEFSPLWWKIFVFFWSTFPSLVNISIALHCSTSAHLLSNGTANSVRRFLKWVWVNTYRYIF